MLQLNRKISKSDTQDQRTWDDIAELRRDLDVDDIRLNQVDAALKVIGTNSPDLQYQGPHPDQRRERRTATTSPC